MTYSSPDPSDERPVPPPLGTVREAGTGDPSADADADADADGSTLDERAARPDVADTASDRLRPEAGGTG